MSITRRIVNGITYVYEIISYRNEEGKPRNHQRILGKIDENGNFIPSKKNAPTSSAEANPSFMNDTCTTNDIINESSDKSTRWIKPYMFMPQNNLTNCLARTVLLSPTRGRISQFAGEFSYVEEYLTGGALTIKMPHYDILIEKFSIGETRELNIHAKKMLDIATLIFAHNGHEPDIKISLEEYMSLCGITNIQKARIQVNAALEALFDFRIGYDDSKKKNRSRNYLDMRICDVKAMKNGIIGIHFTELYAQMLENISIMPYPVAILKASVGKENRNSYFIARKIAEHKYMNIGKKNENVISVKALLKAAPYLPTEEEVRNSDRHFDRRIITPFLNDLEVACEYLGIGADGYELYYNSGVKIPSDELTEMSYETFIISYAHFDDLPDYPDQTKRLEAKKKRKKAAKKKENNDEH